MANVNDWSPIEDGNTSLDQFSLERQISPESELNRYTKKIMAAVRAKVDDIEAGVVTDASVAAAVGPESSRVSRLLTQRFADVVSVLDFGAVGDGSTDDTGPIQTAIDAAASAGRAVWFPQGHSWAVSRLTVPDGSVLLASGSRFIHDGSSYIPYGGGVAAAVPVFDIGADVSADCIEIRFPKTRAESVPDRADGAVGLVVRGDGFYAGRLSFIYAPTEDEIIDNSGMYAAADNAGLSAYGVFIFGSNSHVDFIHSRNLHRPVLYGDESSATAVCRNAFLGGYDISGYLRGIKLYRVFGGVFGQGLVRRRVANCGTVKQGMNGLLLEDCSDVTFAACEIDDAPEHGIRFGGESDKNICFGDVVLKRSGGSAIKICSHSGSAEKPCENVRFGSVSVFDNRYADPGDGIALTRPGEILRVSHADTVSIASLSTYSDIERDFAPDDEDQTAVAASGPGVIAVNNVSRLFVQSIATEDYLGVFFHVDETIDSPSSDSRALYSVSDVRLCNCSIVDSKATTSNITELTLSKSSVSDVLIDFNCDSIGANRNIFSCSAPTTGTVENIRFTGFIRSGTVKFPATCYYKEKIYFDVSLGKIKNIGSGAKSQWLLNDFVNLSHFDPAVDEVNGGLFVTDDIDAADNGAALAYGGAINFSKPGSAGRRGAAIASVQTGSSAKNTGLAVFARTGSTSSNILTSGWLFDHNGNFKLNVTLSGSLGDGNHVWSDIYAENSHIGSSDERLKDNIKDPSEALMRAWGRVNFKVFQFIHSIEEKGLDVARIHVGVVAQQVVRAFDAEGLDAMRYGIVCHDSWDERRETRVVVDAPAVLDDDGNEIAPAQTHLESVTVPAGDRYGIRYGEALALECAYQRWLGQLRDAELERLKDRLAALEVSYGS